MCVQNYVISSQLPLKPIVLEHFGVFIMNSNKWKYL